MAGTTPIKGWPYPSETDSPDVPRDVKNLADALEVVGKNTFGVLSARPTSGMTEGDRYLVVGDGTPANNGMEFVFNGTAWITALSGGAWTALSLASGLVTTFSDYPSSARIEGDRVTFRGSFENTGSSIASGTTLFTLPSGMRPSVSLIYVPTVLWQSGSASVAMVLTVASSGVVVPTFTIGSGLVVPLNNLGFTL